MLIIEDTTESREALGLRHKIALSQDNSAPLAVLVHGRAGTFDVMWAFRRCLPENTSILTPQAPLPDEMMGGYSWWDVEVPRVEQKDTEAAQQQLAAAVRNACNFYELNPRTIIAFGFSQGAGVLSLAIQHTPALYSAVALLAGFVIETTSPQSPYNYPEVFMAHGTKDDIVPIERAYRGRDFLRSHGARVEFHEDPVGHKIGAPSMRALTEWAKSRLTNSALA